jgi:hypothetical protein
MLFVSSFPDLLYCAFTKGGPMKSFIALSFLLLSSQAFSYSTTFSTGTGINCSLRVQSLKATERFGGPSLRVLNFYKFDTLTSDLSKGLSADLTNMSFTEGLTALKDKYTDTNESGLENINPLVALLTSTLENALQGVHIEYDDNAKKITADIATTVGNKHLTLRADFARGVRVFPSTLATSFYFNEETPDIVYDMEVTCSPVAVSRL